MQKNCPVEHNDGKLFCCETCNRSFSKSSHLIIHQRIHTGEKPYQCQWCNKRFSQSSSLSYHIRVHTGERPYQCQQCKKCFSTSSILSTHRRTHTGEKPYQCQQCNKRFPYSNTLLIHMRIHSGERPYQCQQCNKRFSQSHHLSTHMRIHTGEKPYQCPQCYKCFAQSSNLSSHRRIHTKKKACQSQYSRKKISCHQGSSSLSQSSELLQSSFQDVFGNISVCSKPYSLLIPAEDIVFDELASTAEAKESWSDTTSFQTGYYGTTPVTLALLPVGTTIEIVSSSQACLHPNIAMFYGVTLRPFSCPTVVMENVSTSLSHLLDVSGHLLSLRQRLDIAVGCASAVDYLHHQLRVSHGKLSCDYVFLSHSLTAKVLDPVIASLIDNIVVHTRHAMQDDIRHLGHIVVSLFRGVVLSIDSDVCDGSGQCCAPHRLYAILCLLANGEETDIPQTTEILSALERVKDTHCTGQLDSGILMCCVC